VTRNIAQASALFLLALIALGFSALPGYATSTSMSITTSQTSEGPGLEAFTVKVSSQGFNGSSNTLNLPVSQGDEVSITFVYDDPTVNTAHQLAIVGYNIQSTIISQANPTSRIRFVAGQAGSFLIHCIIPCVGMENLQNAWLLVKQAVGKVIRTTLTLQTTLTVQTLQNVAPVGSSLNILARVTDQAGNPITGLIVSFYVSTDFGMMEIGNNVTDTNGMARLTYALPSIRNMIVAADFAGSGIYQGGNATATLTPSNTGTVFVSIGGQANHPPAGEGGPFDPRLVGVPNEVSVVLAGIVLVVILCVWSTFAYVVSLVLKIRQHNSKKNGGNSQDAN
jgi:hypothetical protein